MTDGALLLYHTKIEPGFKILEARMSEYKNLIPDNLKNKLFN
jgi:hypothetical protein